MNEFRYTLLADGQSDHCLIHLINWVLKEIPEVSSIGFSHDIADFRGCSSPPKSLEERIVSAISDYPCDVLFVHRDAEKFPYEARLSEIQGAITASGVDSSVSIIPVRMTEAWLLINEESIRQAAGNPSGKSSIRLPRIQGIENIPDPKSMLHGLLKVASEKHGRRLHRFERDMGLRVQRVASLIRDYSPLRELSAFNKFENDTVAMIRKKVTNN